MSDQSKDLLVLLEEVCAVCHLLHLTSCTPCTALYCTVLHVTASPEQYEQNLAGPALDYVGGDAARLSDPLVSPLLVDYGNGRPFPPTLIQVSETLRVRAACVKKAPARMKQNGV